MTFTYEILYDAWKEVSAGKHQADNQIKYEYYLEDNLFYLKTRLENGMFEPSPLRTKKIFIPKYRIAQVPCVEDKIVQHAICDNYVYECLTKPLIKETSACIIGRGDLYAADILTENLHKFYRRYHKPPYILKCDIHQYFASIPHERLFYLIDKYIEDNDVKQIMIKFVNMTGSGISLGLQQSQLLANIYLSEMDHKIKEELRCKWYNRHMDDFLILFETKEEAERVWKWIDNYVQSIGLELNKKTAITYNKVDFLGFTYHVTNTGKVIKRLQNSKKKTQAHRLRLLTKELNEGIKSPEKVAQSYQGWRAHALQGNTLNVVLTMDERFRIYLKEIGYDLQINKRSVTICRKQ